jgi:hypothetical protein
MPNLNVLRLHPVDPTDGDCFQAYLEGLEIIVSDRKLANPSGKGRHLPRPSPWTCRCLIRGSALP